MCVCVCVCARVCVRVCVTCSCYLRREQLNGHHSRAFLTVRSGLSLQASPAHHPSLFFIALVTVSGFLLLVHSPPDGNANRVGTLSCALLYPQYTHSTSPKAGA